VGWLTKLYFALRGNGWFMPSASGGLFPFPFSWQAWVMTFGFVALLLATMFLPVEAGWAARIVLAAGYVLFGMMTYETPDRTADQ